LKRVTLLLGEVGEVDGDSVLWIRGGPFAADHSRPTHDASEEHDVALRSVSA